MTLQDALVDLERRGCFERARNGDDRAASLFVRAAAYLANPSGDRSGWGWLRKTAGGKNVDGYAEDALVLGSDPNNLFNVYDCVGGAGAPGARLGFNGPLPRRTSDVWEAPRELSATDAAYINLTGGNGGGGNTGGSGGGSGGAGHPLDLGSVLAAIDGLAARVAALDQRVTDLDPVVRATHDYARDGRAAIEAFEMPAVVFPEYTGELSILRQRVPVSLKPRT